MKNNLGIFQIIVLQSIELLKENAYGSEITRTIKKYLSIDRSPSQVYVTLNRLKRDGLITIEHSMGQKKAIRGGRRSVVYSLSDQGKVELAEII